MAMQRIKDESENAKMQLSQTERVDISIPFICTGSDGQPRNLDESLTRSQFEDMCKELVARCKSPVKDAIKASKVAITDINEFLLVGGATRMPMVKKLVKEIFGSEPKSTVNPDESVAQ